MQPRDQDTSFEGAPMARPIPQDTTVVRLDASGNIIHMLSYGGGVDDPFMVKGGPPVKVTAITPDGHLSFVDYQTLHFATTYTKIGLYSDGSIASWLDQTAPVNGQPNYVLRTYAAPGNGQVTTFGHDEFTFTR